MTEYTFFGVQVAIENFRSDPLRKKLHQLVAADMSAQTLFEKRSFWKKATATLNEAMPVFARGYWDLVRGARAAEEFESWASEIEGSLATETEELGAAADEVHRSSAERSYLLVTMMFLAERGSNADLTLGERCDLSGDECFTRQTFAHLIATAPLLNFTNVQADAIYLVPGNDEDGLSDDDLTAGGYDHLKPLT